jgi:hypothetical protein
LHRLSRASACHASSDSTADSGKNSGSTRLISSCSATRTPSPSSYMYSANFCPSVRIPEPDASGFGNRGSARQSSIRYDPSQAGDTSRTALPDRAPRRTRGVGQRRSRHCCGRQLRERRGAAPHQSARRSALMVPADPSWDRDMPLSVLAPTGCREERAWTSLRLRVHRRRLLEQPRRELFRALCTAEPRSRGPRDRHLIVALPAARPHCSREAALA